MFQNTNWNWESQATHWAFLYFALSVRERKYEEKWPDILLSSQGSSVTTENYHNQLISLRQADKICKTQVSRHPTVAIGSLVVASGSSTLRSACITTTVVSCSLNLIGMWLVSRLDYKGGCKLQFNLIGSDMARPHCPPHACCGVVLTPDETERSSSNLAHVPSKKKILKS